MQSRSDDRRPPPARMPAGRWIPALLRHVRRGVDALRASRRRARDRLGLRAMDDRDLNDLGIGRGEIGYVMRQSGDERPIRRAFGRHLALVASAAEPGGGLARATVAGPRGPARR